MAAPATVVYLIENLALGGGIETVLRTLLRGISRERYRILPWFLAEAGPSFERMRTEWPETRFLNVRTYHRPGPVGQLAHELRAARPAFVHAHGYFSGTMGRLIAPWLGLPWVYSMYSHYEDTYRFSNYLTERILAKTRGTIVACSEVVKEFAVKRCGIPPEKVVVNYEGVDVPPESAWPAQEVARQQFGVPREAVVVGAVTRFYPGKNTQLLIRALEGLPAAFHVLLAGNGPEQSALEQLARDLRIADRVHFVGLLSDITPAHIAMDVFVQTSKIREGFSMALVEAMAYARPVIATAVGGNAEAVTPAAGWLIPSDDVPALREALLRALNTREALPAMGRAGRARYLERFTGQHMVRGMEAVYDRLLRGDRVAAT